MSVETFSASLSEAFAALKRDIAYGTAQIDSYAAHSPPEFFAVASEYYFLAPEHLNAIYPGVYSQLDAFYRRST